MSSSESDDDFYGPALPPHLMQKKVEEATTAAATAPEPEPSRSGVIGPSLPPGLSKASQQVEEPVDPSPRAIAKRPSVYGPVVPDKYNDDDKEGTSGYGDYEKDHKNWDDNAGNEEDDHEEDDDDDSMIGPFPPGDPRGEALRAARLPGTNTGDGEKLKREEWMLVPPKNKPISGLASRKFLPRALDTGKAEEDNDEDDETNEKQDLKEEFQAKLIEKRDELMSNLQSESRTGRSGAESLLESHRKNIKKRKLEDAKQGPVVKERKPFDRETDLKVFKMDTDAKNKFINRATSELQGKFSHGKKSGKFL